MKTVIMAGGRGTRICELFPDIPKPMIPINDKPVLEWELISLRDQGFCDVILTVSHMAEVIMQYFGDGEKLGIHIEYFFEKEPLGNAGALFLLDLEEDFLLLNADVMFDVDFQRMVQFHREKGGMVTLFTHPNSHPYDSAVLITDGNGAVNRWLTKEEERPEYYKNRVNAGLHVISAKALKFIREKEKIVSEMIGKTGPDGKPLKIDLDRQVLKPLCETGQVFCYDSPEYVKDMGTPERYAAVVADFMSGKIKERNLSNKQKAIFLDRDGTINQYVGFLRKPEELFLIPGAAEAIRLINESSYLAIVVTNQPVIARGEVTVEELNTIHNKMETLLGAEGAYIDALYYCPHHPHKGYEGEIAELKIDCECRKPKPGMLLQAAEDFNIDLGQSWMIGDGENDVLAGKSAGTQTIYLNDSEDSSGRENASFGQNETCISLLTAVKRILQLS